MKTITFQRLKNRALFYLERYEANSQKLKTVLINRLKKDALKGDTVPPQATEWVEQVVQEMQRLNYVNDTRYIENTIRRLKESGKSRRFILGKLMQSGLTADDITPYLEEVDELASARLFVRKKHLGADYQKDLAKLARAGFSFDVAQKVLEEKNEF